MHCCSISTVDAVDDIGDVVVGFLLLLLLLSLSLSPLDVVAVVLGLLLVSPLCGTLCFRILRLKTALS